LARAGCVAAAEEAEELAASAGDDTALLESLVARRLDGEPLAWLTGQAAFGPVGVLVHPGVYVPRWQSIALARRAAARLPEHGCAVDVCTGTGAIAMALRAARPQARVIATDNDPRAVACARANGVEVVMAGDLFAPLARSLQGHVDVVVAVAPYVPSPALAFLPSDTLRHEDPAHYDGGSDGTEILRRVVAGASRFLRPGGALLLELGGEQADLLEPVLSGRGFVDAGTWRDEDGDVRGVEATLAVEPDRTAPGT
jgi:release factor glutamine methyltransferase